MKIMLVKFYQGVSLVGPTLASFTPDEGLSDKAQARGFSAEVVDKGVMLYAKNEKQAALVPWNNVAYIRYATDATESKPKATKTKAEATKIA